MEQPDDIEDVLREAAEALALILVAQIDTKVQEPRVQKGRRKREITRKHE